jgi:hypothetical protein
LDKEIGGNLAYGPLIGHHTCVWGEHRRLYSEARLAYIISDEENPTNHLIFSLDTDLGSSLLQLTDAPEVPLEIRKKLIHFHEIPPPTSSVWNKFFDGASSKEGAGAGVVFVSPCQETIPLSYKL